MASIRRRSLFVILYLVMLLIILEGASYIVVAKLYDNSLGNQSERHLYSSIRGHQLNPTYRRVGDTENTRIHSSQGFRRDELVILEKPSDTIRIIMLGGSTLYGIGVQQDDIYPTHRTLFNNETVPFFLQKLLQDHFSPDESLKFEVINAGVVAYHTFHHVLYFYETLHEYDPDLLLFLDGHNDFYNMGVKNPIKEYPYSSARMIDALNDRRIFFSIYMLARYFGDYSYFSKLVEKATKRLFESYETSAHKVTGNNAVPDGDLDKALADSARVGFLRNYRIIEAFARYHDFEFHVFLQPEIVFENRMELSESDRSISSITEELYGQDRVNLMKEVRNRLPELFSANGIPFTDISSIGTDGKGDSLYIDYAHLTPHGSEVVAGRMFSIVKEMARQRLARRDESVRAVQPAGVSIRRQ